MVTPEYLDDIALELRSMDIGLVPYNTSKLLLHIASIAETVAQIQREGSDG